MTGSILGSPSLAGLKTDTPYGPDPGTGRALWVLARPNATAGSTTAVRADAATLITSDTGGGVHRLDPLTGRELWNLPVEQNLNRKLLTVSGATVILLTQPTNITAPGGDGAPFGAMAALDTADGHTRWSAPGVYSSRAVVIKGVVTGTNNGTAGAFPLRGIDATTGRTTWELQQDQQDPQMADDGTTAYAWAQTSSNVTELQALDPGGQRRWQKIEVKPDPAAGGGGSPATLDRGDLFATTLWGEVLCYHVTAGPA